MSDTHVFSTGLSRVGGDWCRSSLIIAVIAFGLVLLGVSPAFALPEGRVYEMVSPVFKGGFGASRIEAVGQNGESVGFFSPGTFAGAPAGLSGNIDHLPYLARRGASGWSTEPLMPPDALAPYGNEHDISPELTSTLALDKPGSSNEGAGVTGLEARFELHSTSAPDVSSEWELVGQPLAAVTGNAFELKYEGASADFCHILFTTPKPYVDPLMEAARGLAIPLYELNRGCGGEQAGLQLVGVNNQGSPISPPCIQETGIYTYDGEPNQFNSISAHGGEVFFTTCIENVYTDHQLFVRLGGYRTLEVSRPLASAECPVGEVPCKEAAKRANANFMGASEDGSRVFFTTTAPLTGEGQASVNNLYMATIGCSAESEPECPAANREVTGLVRVSRGENPGEVSGVQGVVRVAPDGSRVYYVTTGDLLSGAERAGLEAEGRPVPSSGAENLYVYDAVSEKTSFIGDLCSGAEVSGSVVDPHCPANPSEAQADTVLWHPGAGSEAQMGGSEGQFLVFSSFAQLVPGDTDTTRDIYRYDAETGTLDRVSIGENGYDSNGNNDAFGTSIHDANLGGSVQRQYELNSRAISENGSRIVFVTAEPLSPEASNGLPNAYEWHEGRVSLISTGTSETPVEDVVISGEGNDVFFVTTQGLVPQDTDGEPDVYDARLNGGFPAALAPSQPCSGDACQGPLTNPEPLLIPGSAVQAPGQNFPPPTKPASPRPKSKPKAIAKHKATKKVKKDEAKRAARTRTGHETAIGGKR